MTLNFFQILKGSFLTDQGIDLVNYSFAQVGKLYGYMMELAVTTQASQLNQYFEGLIDSFYAIAGIFMLFRITISVFNYILDPDKMSDSKSSPTKLITNVFITVLLLIGFAPHGAIYNFLNDVEEVFLFKGSDSAIDNNEDGFFNRLFRNVKNTNSSPEGTSPYKNNSAQVLAKDVFLIGDVKAIENLKCYYNPDESTTSDAEAHAGTYYVEFLRNEDGTIKKIKDFHIPGEVRTGISSNGTTAKTSLPGSVKNKISSCTDLQVVVLKDKKNGRASNGQKNKYRIEKSNANVDSSKEYGRVMEVDEETAAENRTNNQDTIKGNNHGLEPEELVFANSMAGGFYSCNMDEDSKGTAYNNYQKYVDKVIESKNKKSTTKPLLNIDNEKDAVQCYTFEVAPLSIKDAGDVGKKLVVDDNLDYYFFTGIIFSIAVMVYLVVICVEVIIRNLKLILFQIIAPIPIINGIDPNDQMRTKWLKSYFGAYLDLFMKVFCIQLLARVAILIPGMSEDLGTMGKLFFLVALLTFVKMVPNLISKILGIEGLAGSTKEIGGMLKKGLGIGAGVAIGGTVGAAVGAMTGKGVGGSLLGAARGLTRGIGSGMKKDYFGGSRSIAATNKTINDAKANGLGVFDRAMAGLSSTVGYSKKEQMDNAIKEKVDTMEMLDDYKGNKKKLEDVADGNDILADLKTKVANGEMSIDAYKKIRKNYIIAVSEGRTKFDTTFTNLKTGAREGGIRDIETKEANKINHALTIMKDSYAVNGGLREAIHSQIEVKKAEIDADSSLTVAQKAAAKSRIDQAVIKMDRGTATYADFLETEGLATLGKNANEEEINRIKSSSEYAKATALEEFQQKSGK